MTRFSSTPDGILVALSDQERVFLGDVLPLLAGVGLSPDDPATERLNVPVYLDDPDSNQEWWRLMGDDLAAAKRSDRSVFETFVSAGPVTLDDGEADAVLRVLNEARLVLGARMGVEVEDDHERLPEDSRQILDYLSWIQEELIIELTKGLGDGGLG